MNNSIVKTFIGRHIDLSKVVSISDAKFIDRMGNGGWYVGFEIHIQLMDEPIRYERKFDHDEYKFIDGEHKLVYLTNGNKTTTTEPWFGGKILAVERLQKEINELIEQWKNAQ